jgi:hypothetical protein
MKKIKLFREYINEANETGSKGAKVYSPIDDYKVLAFEVSRAFSLLTYFVSLIEKNVNPDDFRRLSYKLNSEKDYNKKWDFLLKTAKSIQSQLSSYSSDRFSKGDINLGKFFDVGQESKIIPVALEKLKTASDILVSGMDKAKIDQRLELLDQAFPKEPFKVTGSLVSVSEGLQLRTPTETEVLRFADMMASEIVSMRLLAKSMRDLFPKSESYIDGVVSTHIDPVSDKINDVLTLEFPDDSVKVPRTVSKSYEGRGWLISTAKDKLLVDTYESLETLRKGLKEAEIKIRKAKDNIIDSLGSQSQATEYIQAATRMLDEVESVILGKHQKEELARRGSLMIKKGFNEPLDEPQEVKKEADPEQLRDLLRRKYSAR